MSLVGRRELVIGGVVLVAGGIGTAALLSSCSKGGGNAAPTPDDITIGAANAPVNLIEYASLACPHCQEFEETVWPRLKSNYIDTGKIRFTMREYPTAAPPDIVLAEFQVARCGNATPDQYYTRVSALFAQRTAIFSTGTREGVRDKLIQFGASAGLSQDQILACIADEAGAARFQRVVDAGTKDFQISGTPTFVLNGTKIEDPTVTTYEGMSRILDAAIAAHH